MTTHRLAVVLMLVLLGSCMTEARLRSTRHHTFSVALDRNDENPLERISRQAREALERAEASTEASLRKSIGVSVKKPLMDGMTSFRIMMCWGRPDLIGHPKCLDFMTTSCEKETSGQGLCQKLFDYLNKECKKGSKLACASADEMGFDIKSVDSDGDGVPDTEDAFLHDPNESKDSDGDGVGDNADAFPHDPKESKDSDGDGVGDNADAFPHDPNETKDSDGDGVGDNADAFPHDPSETKDSDSDGVGDNADAFPNDPTETKDSDGDGVGDNADAFPNDPNEAKDSDGDGVGDNADAFPHDPTRTKDSDGASETKDSDGDADSRKLRQLPLQGYNEYGLGNTLHEDMQSQTHDWQRERPVTPETEQEATERICRDYPEHDWCQLYLKHREREESSSR